MFNAKQTTINAQVMEKYDLTLRVDLVNTQKLIL
jgi:hypothetical protein